MMKCGHCKGRDSTLQTSFFTVPWETIGKTLMFVVECTICGSMTEPCFCPDEAVKRACAEWWMVKHEKVVG